LIFAKADLGLRQPDLFIGLPAFGNAISRAHREELSRYLELFLCNVRQARPKCALGQLVVGDCT